MTERIPEGATPMDEMSRILGSIFEKCRILKSHIAAGRFSNTDVTFTEGHLFIALEDGKFAYLSKLAELGVTSAPVIPVNEDDIEGLPVSQLRPLAQKLNRWLSEI